MHKIISIIAVVALALGLQYAVNTYVLKKDFNLTDTLINFAVVLVVVGLSSAIVSKVSHSEAHPTIKV